MAIVIGETPDAARDGAELVVVDYDVLPSVTDREKAASPGRAQIHDNAPGNVAFNWEIGDEAETDAAFKAAPIVVKQRIVNQRLVPNAIEPRACVARTTRRRASSRSGSPPRTPTCTGCSWRRSCWGCPSTRCA